tara:strand:+ start:75048 stop:77000 length:1953 start_codon:yes stop_codon:yes gene_type:complete
LERDKIICAGWIGRFGNRCHSYLYGKHIEDKFGYKFYIPTEWDGSVLFKNPAPVVSSNFSNKRFIYAGGSSRNLKTFDNNKKKLSEYNTEHDDDIEFVDTFYEKNYGKSNIAYIGLMTDAPWFYPKVSLSDIRRYFEFTDEVKNSDVYRELESRKGTYDIAHFRRTDISRKTYKGGHSMVSKKSYYDAFEKFGVDRRDVEWVSDESDIGWKWKGPIPTISGRRISWLPDFLKLIFARKVFRSNSSFSLWSSWFGDVDVYAPVLHKYSPGHELDFEFVRGNHPHWMSVRGVHSNYEFLLNNGGDDSSYIQRKVNMEVKNKTKPKQSNVVASPERGMIMMVHWNGRFGNRLGSYAFGRNYAEKYNLDFYIPSEWEGTRLFVDDGYKIVEDDDLRLNINQSKKPYDSLQYRAKMVAEWGNRVNKKLTYMNPDDPAQYGKTNVFYDSLCVNGEHIFKDFSRKKFLKWFQFTDEVKNLDIYKRLEDKQGTYDIAHLRRDDISNPNYNKRNHQGYSVVNKQSYLNAFEKFGYDVSKMEWTTDDWTGKWGVGKPQHGRGGWSYPVGSRVLPDVIFDWLPDFLRLYFARTIFRGNSSFSWWAACLSPTAKIYSPVLTKRKIYFGESDELDFDFVEGNHPHWLNFKGNGRFAEEIIIPD